MRIWTKVVSRWDEELARYVADEALSEWYIYEGPIEHCKGASAAQENLANEQAQFYQQLTAQQSQTFAEQQSILSTLQSSLSPTINAGPNQYGYSPAEDTALRTQALEGTGSTYANAAKALNEQIGAEGGGNSYVPSGASNQLREQVATSAANQEAQQNLGITTAGYAQGLANYNEAVKVMSGTAQIYNPTGYANSATNAGSTAFNSASTIQQMNNSSGFWNTASGILGGAAGDIAGGLTGGLGTAVSTVGNGDWGW
jgi:hypothetical protein